MVRRFAESQFIVPIRGPERERCEIAFGRSARFHIALFQGLGKLMLPYLEDLDVNQLHVQAPTEVIFLCGGPYEETREPEIKSLRHAFHCIVEHPALKGRDIIVAERVTRQLDFSQHYKNLLEFEKDIAQITELVLLFCESAGSFTELGSFSSYEEIYSQLLVVIRQVYWEENSFIKLGPLEFLKQTCGRESIFVIRDEEVGIRNQDIKTIDIDLFKTIIQEPLRKRLAATREPTTFHADRAGHRIKLIVGLIQEYGALEFHEIASALRQIGLSVTDDEVKGYLLCAKSVFWIEEKASGFGNYWIAIEDTFAINFAVKASAEEIDRTRRRILIRRHWQTADETRFRMLAPIPLEELEL